MADEYYPESYEERKPRPAGSKVAGSMANILSKSKWLAGIAFLFVLVFGFASIGAAAIFFFDVMTWLFAFVVGVIAAKQVHDSKLGASAILANAFGYSFVIGTLLWFFKYAAQVTASLEALMTPFGLLSVLPMFIVMVFVFYVEVLVWALIIYAILGRKGGKK